MLISPAHHQSIFLIVPEDCVAPAIVCMEVLENRKILKILVFVVMAVARRIDKSMNLELVEAEVQTLASQDGLPAEMKHHGAEEALQVEQAMITKK